MALTLVVFALAVFCLIIGVSIYFLVNRDNNQRNFSRTVFHNTPTIAKPKLTFEHLCVRLENNAYVMPMSNRHRVLNDSTIVHYNKRSPYTLIKRPSKEAYLRYLDGDNKDPVVNAALTASLLLYGMAVPHNIFNFNKESIELLKALMVQTQPVSLTNERMINNSTKANTITLVFNEQYAEYFHAIKQLLNVIHSTNKAAQKQDYYAMLNDISIKLPFLGAGQHACQIATAVSFVTGEKIPRCLIKVDAVTHQLIAKLAGDSGFSNRLGEPV